MINRLNDAIGRIFRCLRRRGSLPVAAPQSTILETRYRDFIFQSAEGIWRVALTEPIPVSLPIDEQVTRIFATAQFAEVNDSLARMYGYHSGQELSGRRVSEVLPPSDLRNVQYLYNFVESGYRLTNAISRELNRFGQPKVFVNCLIGVVEEGKLTGAWGTQHDVTEAQNAKEELSISNAKLEALIDSSNDAIISKSLEGTILSWNAAAERIFGYRADEVVGRSLKIIIPPERWDEERDILQQIAEGKRVELRETERLTKSGRRIIISVSTSPIKDQSGAIIGAAKIARDITERRHQETMLKESEARYRKLAEERTALLEHERAVRTEIEQVNREKDEFLLTLSHELRTPLNAILGWAQLAIRRFELPDELRKGLEVIERNARAQARMIEELLEMNRIISGKMRLDLHRLDLSKTLYEAVASVRSAADAKSVRISTHIPSSATIVRGDSARLLQVFWNLLANAVKFTPRGGAVSVEVRLARPNVEINVHDTGEGINPEFLPYLFDRFRQADSSTTRRHGGLGLGLAIVRHVIELHGGTVSATSQGAGQGSTFTITLPLMLEEELPEFDEHETENMRSALRDARILVVDDDPDAQTLMQKILESEYAIVRTAGSAREALELLSRFQPQVILSDIGMPDEDGYRFIEEVRARTPLASIPAVAVTAFARNEDRQMALRSGFQRHLAKPLEPEVLVATVADLLREPAGESGFGGPKSV